MIRLIVFQRLIVLSLAYGLLSAAMAWAWDGNWTQAESGRGDVIDNPDSKHGNAGTPERPQRFHIPPPRDWANVDPEELDEYKRKDYTPYALARITRNIHYEGRPIPKGYYVIKPGDSTDGSPLNNLQRYAQPPNDPRMMQPISDTGSEDFPNPIKLTPAIEMPSSGASPSFSMDADTIPAVNQTPTAGSQSQAQSPPLQPLPSREQAQPGGVAAGSGSAKRQKAPQYNVFVIKKLGNVVAVIPIHRMERYTPPKGEKTPRHALAWLDVERQNGVERPVLRFYHKHTLYSTDFE